jgi:hypothetical protein
MARKATPPDVITVLTAFLNSLHSSSRDLMQTLESGRFLHHYTTLDGAVSILSGGDLWLSNARFSNDDEEVRYGHRIVTEVIDGMMKKAGKPAARGELAEVRARVDAAIGDQAYICCFCEKDNLLSQWRGYADNGGGVSVEIDPVGLSRITGHYCAHGLMRLWKVFYSPELQRKIIRHCIEYRHWPGGAERIRFITDAIKFFLPTFKNADFSEEQERRLIFTPDPKSPVQPKFRARRGLLVPYYRLQDLCPRNPDGTPAFRVPVTGLTIGPAPHRALNVESMSQLVQALPPPAIAVRASTTPYRA